MQPGADGKIRCFGNLPGHEIYANYHDNEWGVPVYDDNKLFEMLILEGAHAGLNFELILKKKAGYRRVFKNFFPTKVSRMTDAELENALKTPDIVRNRLKVFSARKNAQVFLKIQAEFGTFAKYLWSFVEGKPVINHWQSHSAVPATTPTSDLLSKDLKKRGMSFVGSKIIYSYMQSVGMVNDHVKGCWLHPA